MTTRDAEINVDDTINTPRRVYDSEKVEQKNSSVTLQSTGYQDPITGFNELCSTYHTTFSPTRPVFDLPSRPHRLFLSFLVDWIILAIMLSLLALWWAKPPKFYFRLDDPDISYPDVEETVSALAVILLIVGGPILVVTLAQIWVRSFRDWHQSVLAALTLFATCQLVCTCMWALIGGLRPSFLAICLPDLSRAPPIPSYPGAPEGVGLIYYSDDVCSCSEKDLIRAKHAFPSGHAASVFAVAIYLSIYVSAKLKLFDNRSHLWKFIFPVGFMIIAIWIGFSRIRDGRHHFKDIIIGQLIGAVIAPLVYRLHFCSITGPDNHIPTRYTWTGRFFPYPFVDQYRARHSKKTDQLPGPNGPNSTSYGLNSTPYGPNPTSYGPNSSSSSSFPPSGPVPHFPAPPLSSSNGLRNSSGPVNNYGTVVPPHPSSPSIISPPAYFTPPLHNSQTFHGSARD